jgi:hypothetical protein
MALPNAIVRGLRAAALDRPLGYALLGNVLSAVAGPVTVYFIATRFSPVLQGYYYTFGSIVSLQFIAELGLGQTVMQFISHEWPFLRMRPGGRLTGETEPLQRTISLARAYVRRNTALALVSGLALYAIGVVVLSRPSGEAIAWQAPWAMLCTTVVLNFCVSPFWSLLQGCNQLSSFWLYRGLQQLLNAVVLWVSIALGADLWSLSIAGFFTFVFTVSFLFMLYPKFVGTFLVPPEGPPVFWSRDVWPMQWRIAISWFSAYFTAQMFPPLLFHTSGPVVAGQMGMTITLGTIVLAFATNWVVTKAPRFGSLIARQEFRELETLFTRSFVVSNAVAVSMAALAWVAVYSLRLHGVPLADRILPLPLTALYLLAVVLNAATTSMSVYLRAHKKEPLAGAYVASTLLSWSLSAAFALRFHAQGVVIAYLCVTMFLQFPVALLVFRRARVSWHAPVASFSTRGAS